MLNGYAAVHRDNNFLQQQISPCTSGLYMVHTLYTSLGLST